MSKEHAWTMRRMRECRVRQDAVSDKCVTLFRQVMPCTKSLRTAEELERCPGCRRSTPGKCVYVTSVPRVRIPPSPPSATWPDQDRLTNTGDSACLKNQPAISLPRFSPAGLTAVSCLRHHRNLTGCLNPHFLAAPKYKLCRFRHRKIHAQQSTNRY